MINLPVGMSGPAVSSPFAKKTSMAPKPTTAPMAPHAKVQHHLSKALAMSKAGNHKMTAHHVGHAMLNLKSLMKTPTGTTGMPPAMPDDDEATETQPDDESAEAMAGTPGAAPTSPLPPSTGKPAGLSAMFARMKAMGGK